MGRVNMVQLFMRVVPTFAILNNLQAMHIEHTVEERFLRYVKIDTESDPESPSCPSTEKQKNLSRLLVEELHEMGVSDAELDTHGYVYATIPATGSKQGVPVICFCSHVDTSPDLTGKGVKPIVHRNYQGGDIVLPGAVNTVLSPSAHPDLKNQVGHDVITTDGSTLLGADDKAGVAEIMDAARFFMAHPEVKHGTIKLLFTPDEEIGRGVDKVDLKRLGAEYAYTLDGENLGSMEDETFSADGAIITIHGVSAHPGFAKGNMVNALKVAACFLDSLPQAESPEHTEGREGFVHPITIEGSADEVRIKMIFRSFVTAELKTQAAVVEEKLKAAVAKYPTAGYTLEVKAQYRNMKEVLDHHPHMVTYAEEAIKRCGLALKKGSIRGGTDGSRLSFMGLPCPNLFAGGHAFHSKYEWVSVQDMEKAVEMIVHLAMIWEERS
jgi:tripeptide aminopeptidase